jgi:hypothetical protein
MPRAQRTKSAVHEALQRRAGDRPGASFSVKLDAPPQARLSPYRFHTGCFALATSQHTLTMAIHAIRAFVPHEFHYSFSRCGPPSVGVLLTTNSPADPR